MWTYPTHKAIIELCLVYLARQTKITNEKFAKEEEYLLYENNVMKHERLIGILRGDNFVYIQKKCYSVYTTVKDNLERIVNVSQYEQK